MNCHNCDGELIVIKTDLCTITSDCKPCDKKLTLAYCADCGLLQNPVTKDWRRTVKKIYNDYYAYHQAGGKEQRSFNADGSSVERSMDLVKRFNLPETGSLIDIGCGNGNLMKVVKELRPGFKVCGLDPQPRVDPSIGKVFKSFKDIKERFNFAILNNTLEHIPCPSLFMKRVKNIAGQCYINVPHYYYNPYILAVYDHCSHFTPNSIIMALSNYKLLAIGPMAKEFLAYTKFESLADTVDHREFFGDQAAALYSIAKILKNLSSKDYGIFGTSVGGTWAFLQGGSKAQFFVDEDPSRIGRQHLGVPILSVQQVKLNSTVFVALPYLPKIMLIDRMKTIRSDIQWL